MYQYQGALPLAVACTPTSGHALLHRMRLARNTIVPDDEPESSPSSLPPLSLGRNLKVRPEAEEAARALDDEPMLPELLDLTSRTRYKEQFALLDANKDGYFCEQDLQTCLHDLGLDNLLASPALVRQLWEHVGEIAGRYTGGLAMTDGKMSLAYFSCFYLNFPFASGGKEEHGYCSYMGTGMGEQALSIAAHVLEREHTAKVGRVNQQVHTWRRGKAGDSRHSAPTCTAALRACTPVQGRAQVPPLPAPPAPAREGRQPLGATARRRGAGRGRLRLAADAGGAGAVPTLPALLRAPGQGLRPAGQVHAACVVPFLKVPAVQWPFCSHPLLPTGHGARVRALSVRGAGEALCEAQVQSPYPPLPTHTNAQCSLRRRRVRATPPPASSPASPPMPTPAPTPMPTLDSRRLAWQVLVTVFDETAILLRKRTVPASPFSARSFVLGSRGLCARLAPPVYVVLALLLALLQPAASLTEDLARKVQSPHPPPNAH